ncbi:hypothetical protein QAD02_014435, partial [Eretmocerus hayati]
WRSVLRAQYERGPTEPDESNLSPELDEGFDRADFRVEFSPSPNLEGPQFQSRDNATRASIRSSSESSSPPRARTNGTSDDNQEKLYLYVIVSVASGVVVLLTLVIGRLMISRHRAKREAKFHANNQTLPNGFTDEISEIDADIDLTTPVPVPLQDTRLPETQLAERLHGPERYYGIEARMPLSPSHIHQQPQQQLPRPGSGLGVRVDLGNHMIGADSLHTILRPLSGFGSAQPKTTCYYYG